MATTPEGWVKKAVKELLDCWGVYYHMPVQNGMGKPSLDFICCVSGWFLAVETKAPGKQMTLRQAGTAASIRSAGGHVRIIDGWDTFVELWRGFYHLAGAPMEIPAAQRVKWERYFRNAGAKDAHQSTA